MVASMALVGDSLFLYMSLGFLAPLALASNIACLAMWLAELSSTWGVEANGKASDPCSGLLYMLPSLLNLPNMLFSHCGYLAPVWQFFCLLLKYMKDCMINMAAWSAHPLPLVRVKPSSTLRPKSSSALAN